MPIYEFVCAHCKRKFRKLVGVVANSTPPQCPHCQSTRLNLQISRFSRVRGEDESLDSLAEEMESLGESDDPGAMRRLMREMGREMGEDLDDEFDQMMEEEAAGEGSDGEAGSDD